MKGKSIFSTLVFGIIFGLGMVVAYVVRSDEHAVDSVLITAAAFIAAIFVSSAIRIADPWDRAVVLRPG